MRILLTILMLFSASYEVNIEALLLPSDPWFWRKMPDLFISMSVDNDLEERRCIMKVFVLTGFLFCIASFAPMIGCYAGEEIAQAAEYSKAKDEAEVLYQKGVAYYEEEKYESASKAYSKAAEKGHAGAQYNLAIMYEQGKGIKKDIEKAGQLCGEAAEQSFAKAIQHLNSNYRSCRVSEVKQNNAGSCLLVAAAGNAEAQFIVGMLYSLGMVFEKNPKESMKWILKAAEQGHVLAQEQAIRAYYEGFGIPKDTEKMYGWLCVLEEQIKNPEAQGLEAMQKRSGTKWVSEMKRDIQNAADKKPKYKEILDGICTDFVTRYIKQN